GAPFLRARQLGSAEAFVLAVDNSESMRGAPLREAKRAAEQFLGQELRAIGTGLVAFGHVALPLTRGGESKADVAATLRQLALVVRDGESKTALRLTVPGGNGGAAGPIPAAHSSTTAAVIVGLAALLLALAGASLIRRRRTPQISRLLSPHVGRQAHAEAKRAESARFAGLLTWTEEAMGDLPGSGRLEHVLERSGLKFRIGHFPYLALAAAFVLAALATALGAGPKLALLVLLLGLALPYVVFSVAGTRRAKAFDRQLPDVLATVASSLRAG